MVGLDAVLGVFKKRQLGFQIDEVMSGEHQFSEGMGPTGSYAMEFRVTWGTEDLGAWLDPAGEAFMRGEMQGTVTVEGLCQDAPITNGSLALRYFDEAKIRYTFDFAVGDKQYHYIGEKMNIRPWNLPFSHTTCYGVLTEKETGRLVSRSLTHFYLRKAPAFLRSFRLV